MSRLDQVWTFQAIQLPDKDRPLRVLEQVLLSADDCTLEAAKLMFMRRFEDKAYRRKHGPLAPDAVRFVDEDGVEVLRYTSWSYLREQSMEEAHRPDQT